MSLKGRVLFITGGSRGIGFGVLSAFVTAGAKVFYVSRNPIKKKIRDALHIKADLINSENFWVFLELLSVNLLPLFLYH